MNCRIMVLISNSPEKKVKVDRENLSHFSVPDNEITKDEVEILETVNHEQAKTLHAAKYKHDKSGHVKKAYDIDSEQTSTRDEIGYFDSVFFILLVI